MTAPFHLGIALDGAGWHPAAWRDASARPKALFEVDYWVSLVAEARDAGIDLVSIEDSFGLQSEGYGAFELRGDRVRGRLDALLLANTVAAQLGGIGIVPTVTTTHTEPFHTATGIQTLDHVSDGWAGWRVQVSGRTHEAAHVGRREIGTLEEAATGSDEVQTALIRGLFAEAADAIEVARRLWDSWQDDAVIRDVPTGRFIDRERLHYVDFEGENFAVKGPSIVPRSPQGQPLVYVLAHQSVPYELAVAQADVVGITPRDDDHLATILHELSDAAGRIERRAPEDLRVWGELVVLIEDSAAAALAALAALDEELAEPYASDALILAGTAENVAAQLLRWQAAGLSGARLRPARLPLDLERITRGVVPVLAETGVLERPVDAASLREHLGLRRPANRYAVSHDAAELRESVTS
ncbi:LLM class flavin-dependent oxidoreductase [Agreia sp. COWG]|uniref:LLM class flavin-dependent oxidoreductase n=1 Tax=Agreia sp. COWG TaxID=2773266 RepID=UPI0019285255|nr:LLM class flavin-dependent oxidoreductase [Agreia sp. COWG]CAD5991700.1 Bac_luciferase domain-containing protein [Agreia sp. COWG]